MRLTHLFALSSCALTALSGSNMASAQDEANEILCDPVMSANGNAVRSADGNMVAHSGSAPCPVEPVVVIEPVARAVPVLPPPPSEQVVYFPFDVAQLTPEAESEVDAFASGAADRQPTSVRVTGYTDRAGPEDYNMGLSEERAAHVRDALVADGVPESVVTIEGVGESDPAVETEDGVALQTNRRAVISALY